MACIGTMLASMQESAISSRARGDRRSAHTPLLPQAPCSCAEQGNIQSHPEIRQQCLLHKFKGKEAGYGNLSLTLSCLLVLCSCAQVYKTFH